MIPELGHYALVLALAVALAQSVIPLVGASRSLPSWIAVARPAAIAQFGFVAYAFIALMISYVISDSASSMSPRTPTPRSRCSTK